MNKSNNMPPLDVNPKQSSSGTPSAAVLPMRFYANWDVDRTSSPIAVQRILSMVFTRLVLIKSLALTENTPITIAIRLQNSKRTLRSNDITILSTKLETPLDISFVIQYCHYIKRKPNVLQILIQRRKRYKNRQIPGFKTLAIGHLNLDEILQFGGSREVVIWDTTCLDKVRHSMRELHAGRINIVNCYTQPAETTAEQWGASNRQRRVVTSSLNEDKDTMVLSEEEPEEFTSGEESESDMEFTPRRDDPTAGYIERRQKKLKQRNIKQKVFALLRKFKPEDDLATSECTHPHSSRSIAPPTELELQEIFEELENISGDSGPELEPDKLSIVSNPRPKIHPLFGSKSDIMPPIMDLQNEDGIFLSDEIMSADADSEIGSSADAEEHVSIRQEDNESAGQNLSGRKESGSCMRSQLKHSDTANSVNSTNEQKGKGTDPVEELMSKSFGTTTHVIGAEHVWIYSSADLPWISKVNSKMLEPICVLDCPSANTVRTLLQAIIGKIQNFCNNNSVSPTTTTIGVLGGDQLLANVLKAYVVLLQEKACKEDWLNYLRFSIVLPPTTAVGRLLNQVAGFGGYSEAIWKMLGRVSAAFKETSSSAGVGEYAEEIRNCLMNITREQGAQRYTNLHIGEVMLQLSKSCPDQQGGANTTELENRSQVFVPFLAELLTGSSVSSEQSSASNPDPSFSSLLYIRQTTAEEQQGAEPANSANPQAQHVPTSTTTKTAVAHHPHSHSFPTLHKITDPSGKEIPPIEGAGTEEDSTEKGALANRTASMSANSSPVASNDGKDLQIEYWMSPTPSYPGCSSATFSHQQFQQREEAAIQSANVGSKFSMKASVRTLSIAREPMSNLLSILFVKERKKDKMLNKLGRRSKQRLSDTAGAGFCSQSRVVSGVTRIVCTSGTGGMGKKDVPMEILVDGVTWRSVCFFQISAQWQTHVKLFPVSFPVELPVAISCIH